MVEQPLVEAVALERRFGDAVAVDDMAFSIPNGSLVAVIGPSGSGKTTLIRLLLGVLAPTSGTIRTWGGPATGLTQEQRRRLGYLPQHTALLPELSLTENLRFYASMAGLDLGDGQLERALADVELSEQGDRRVTDASGGMQRRLGLAAALIHEPELIVLDEPTAGLDPVLRLKVWERLRDLQQQGRSLLVTTQYVGEAANCDRVLLIRAGRLHFDGTPDELRRRAYGGDVIDIEVSEPLRFDDIDALESLDFVRGEVELRTRRAVSVVVDDGPRAIPRISELLDDREVAVAGIAERAVEYDEAFVQLVTEDEPA